jgi:hypothetical protein
MMNLQYIADKSGHTTAVQLQIPIEEWNSLKSKYKEFEEEENAVSFDIPEWQINLGKEELRNIENGNTTLTDWEVAKKQFKL